LTLTQRITATGTFWLYACILVIAWFFVFFLVPETAGLNLEAIQKLFRADSPASSDPTSAVRTPSPFAAGDYSEEDTRGRRRSQGSFDL
jgi:hypothetical protein